MLPSERSLPDSASPSRTIPRFDREFIERRFQQHREEMAAYEAAFTTDIVIEVVAAVDQARRELERKQLRRDAA